MYDSESDVTDDIFLKVWLCLVQVFWTVRLCSICALILYIHELKGTRHDLCEDIYKKNRFWHLMLSFCCVCSKCVEQSE